MAAGAICTNGRYKVGGAFSATSTAVYSSDSTTPTYKWYSSEIGGWLANAGVSGGASPTALGQTDTVVSGATAYTTSDLVTATGTVTNVTFYRLVKSIEGDGTVAVTSGTLYGGMYLVSGASITLTATAGTGRAVNSFKVGGTSRTNPYTMTVASDVSVEAKFTYTSYSLPVPSTPTGGTIALYKNGTAVTADTTVVPGDVIRYVCTASTGYTFSYIEIDGARYATADTSLTVMARTSDSVINASANFVSTESIENTITATGSGSVSVKDANGNSVTIGSDGKFSCYRRATYYIHATPTSGYYVEGVYEGTRKVSSTVPYQYVQYGDAFAFSVLFAEGSESSVEVMCGSSSTATDVTWNGCSCSYTNSGTSYTFTPTAASGYAFKRLYIKDLGGTGKGCVIESGSSLTKTIDFRARVVAIFESTTTPAEPSDEDQGGSPTASTKTIGEWEGGLTRMTAKWASRRNVFSKPVSLSAARLYCEKYDANGPKLNIRQYQSPAKTDTADNSVSIVIPSQNAVRLIARRPEKYVEVEVESDSTVLEVAVGTSMEALCQST